MNKNELIASLIHIDGVTEEEILSLLTTPKDLGYADLALPCFRFAKALRKSPVDIAKALADDIGVPVVANTCVKPLVAELKSKNKELYNGEMVIYPIELYLRPTWLDR